MILCVQVLEGYNGSVFAYGQTGTGKTYTMGTEAGQYQPATINDGLDLVVDNDNISSMDVQKDNQTINAKEGLTIDKAGFQIEDTDNVQNAEKEDSNIETDNKEKDKLHIENVQGLGTIAEESSENEDSQLMDTTDDIDHNAATAAGQESAANDDISTAKEAGQIEDNVGIIPRVIKEIFSNDSNISVKVRYWIFIALIPKDFFAVS